MGRPKTKLGEGKNKANKSITFSHRKNSLVKKAYELSTLCEIDLALIFFTPTGKLSLFDGKSSVEETLERYLNLPPPCRESVNNEEMMKEALNRIKLESSSYQQRKNCFVIEAMNRNRRRLEEHRRKLNEYNQELENVDKHLEPYFKKPGFIKSIRECKLVEKTLYRSLKLVCEQEKVLELKKELEKDDDDDTQLAAIGLQLPNGSMGGDGISINNFISWLDSQNDDGNQWKRMLAASTHFDHHGLQIRSDGGGILRNQLRNYANSNSHLQARRCAGSAKSLQFHNLKFDVGSSSAGNITSDNILQSYYHQPAALANQTHHPVPSYAANTYNGFPIGLAPASIYGNNTRLINQILPPSSAGHHRDRMIPYTTPNGISSFAGNDQSIQTVLAVDNHEMIPSYMGLHGFPSLVNGNYGNGINQSILFASSGDHDQDNKMVPYYPGYDDQHSGFKCQQTGNYCSNAINPELPTQQQTKINFPEMVSYHNIDNYSLGGNFENPAKNNDNNNINNINNYNSNDDDQLLEQLLAHIDFDGEILCDDTMSNDDGINNGGYEDSRYVEQFLGHGQLRNLNPSCLPTPENNDFQPASGNNIVSKQNGTDDNQQWSRR